MLKAKFEKHVLEFKLPAGTSRGILYTRPTWLLKLWEDSNESILGVGECAPLVKLSIDDRPDFEEKLQEVCGNISDYQHLEMTDLIEFPAIRTGIEMAFRDLASQGKQLYFGSETSPEIPINGLIWMGEYDFMKSQIDRKLEENWGCIKMKIGAIDFDKELRLLHYIRSNNEKVEIRVDANGAFDESNVFEKLDALSRFRIHSIEQPVKPGQYKLMNEVCRNSPIPVGLDEEMIGIYGEKKIEILDAIQPQALVIKPTLVGGFAQTDEWIKLAEQRGIRWWITSTLESSYALKALRQYVAEKKVTEFQGLGTGLLFKENL